MISINKHRIKIEGDLETIGAEFMLLSSTIRRTFKLKPSDLAYMIRAAYDTDQDIDPADEPERFTVIMCKGREIFNIGNY